MDEKNIKLQRNHELAAIIKNTYGKPELTYEYNAACAEFLKNYKSLFYKFIKLYKSSNKSMIYDDLMVTFQQSAINACLKFDETKGSNITSYLHGALNNAIHDYHSEDTNYAVHINTHTFYKVYKAYMEQKELNSKKNPLSNNNKPTKDSLKEIYNFKDETLNAFFNLHKFISLNKPVKYVDSNNVKFFGDTIIGSVSPETEAVESSNREDLKLALNFMPKKHRKIIKLFYINNMSQCEISKILNVSQSYVCKELNGSINTLKTLYEYENLLAIKLINKLKMKNEKLVKLNIPNTLENLIKGENISEEQLCRMVALSKYKLYENRSFLKLLNNTSAKVLSFPEKFKNAVRDCIVLNTKEELEEKHSQHYIAQGLNNYLTK